MMDYVDIDTPSDVLYTVSRKQRRQALDAKATIVIDMHPLDFIRIATCNPLWEGRIRKEAAPLTRYMTEEWESIVHPMLSVEMDTGLVMGHEGRHRAAAVYAEGGKWYRVAIVLRPSSRQYTYKDVPLVIHTSTKDGSFCGIDLSSAERRGRLRMVHPNVQEQYQDR